MSRKFKSQASSARAASSLTSGFGGTTAFQTNTSSLAYVTEAPDLTQISQPNVVVAFKNLSKRDSTTKAKALEELTEYCSSGDCEQAILSAWCDIYPRTSIDNSRKVRQLSHDIQGTLTKLCGKRIAPLLSNIAGAWLAGTFDNDKVVARAARDALEKSFSTPEKRRAIWKVYRESLIEYAEDAILVQTQTTLSDERTTSPDEAEAKYVRVVAGGIHILTQLLEDDAPFQAANTFLAEKHLWELIAHHDPYLRRAICQVIRPACKTYSDQIDWKMLSSSFLAKGLQSSQVGSSTHFVEALIVLTHHHAEVWTSDYNSKTAVSKRLNQFLKKGSQSGPDRVWPAIRNLLESIPPGAWLTGNILESTTALIEAVRSGVSQPSERINAMTAWETYLEIGFWLLSLMQQERIDFSNSNIAPIVFHYIVPNEKQRWALPHNATRLCAATLFGLIERECQASATKVWMEAVDATIDAMKMSLPESSKAFRSSQDAVVAQAGRLFQVRDNLFSLSQSRSVMIDIVADTQAQMLVAALDLLVARNGKPYAAASIVNALVRDPKFDVSNTTLQDFITNSIPSLMSSPSAEQLILLSLAAGRTDGLETLVQRDAEGTPNASNFLLKHITEEQLSTQLQSSVEEQIKSFSNPGVQEMARSILSNRALKGMHRMILAQVQTSLLPQASDESQQGALVVLDDTLAAIDVESALFAEFRQSLLSSLLVLSDSNTHLSEQARQLASRIDAKNVNLESSISIIQQQLNGQGSPLSIFTLVELAESAVKKGTATSSILPTEQQWQQALTPLYNSPRPLSLSITNPLQGTIYYVQPSVLAATEVPRDSDTLSVAFRLALYTIKLVGGSDKTSHLEGESRSTSQRFLPIVMELINEKLTNESANGIWLQNAPELVQEAGDMLSDSNRIFQDWIDHDEDFINSWLSKAQFFEDLSTATYCEASAWVRITSQFVDQNGPSRLLQQYEQDLKTAHRSPHLIKMAAILAVLREHLPTSAVGKRVINELVAKATEIRSDFEPLVLLNVLLQGLHLALEGIPNQRIVLLLINAVSLLDEPDLPGLKTESVKLIGSIVPLIADLYGGYWESMLGYINRVWQTDATLPLINATLRLYSRLLVVSQTEDVNEDLTDALRSLRQDLDQGLFNCLFLLTSDDVDVDQPRDITSELLGRLLKGTVPKDQLALFSLLSSRVEAVQNAAYEILHRTIPQLQEQLSVELVLDKTTIRLPEDLMALLDGTFATKQYFLAWNLVFDHFPKASYSLRESYTSDIKSSGHVNGLLDLICEIIRITNNRTIDASKFDISTFNPEGQETTEKEMQHLAIHTYYNTLLYLPSLAKEWFIAQKNRIKSPLEGWTQKYISPSIVAASVSSVTQWAAAQTEDERALEIKSSPRGTELIASIEIDPENPPISLSVALPGNYPFESPSVTSRTRVGVSEKNWQSWLRTFQIIIFSTGSIVEGLIAFRHNVQGALKGQSECAICYSIIGTDKQTPNKKCNTCKNTFHGSCLFRWFKSSNSSSCPLCRNNFNYA